METPGKGPEDWRQGPLASGMHGDLPGLEDSESSPRGSQRGGHSHGRSFLLVVVAGTGGPTSDLTAELFYQLWVLLLHLLSELLAPAGGAQAQGEARPLPWPLPAAHADMCPGRSFCAPTRARGRCGCSLEEPRQQHLPLPLPCRGGVPAPLVRPPQLPTHAWMRLARSFCEGLVPGVPRGL